MAAENASPPAADTAAAAALAPAVTLSMSNSRPITPVEHTATTLGSRSMPSAAVAPIVAASAMPLAPVCAFALPALTTTACSRVRSKLRVWMTDSEGSAFDVSTSALAAWRVLRSTPMSSPPDSFRPQATPLATKPGGVVIPPMASRSSSGGNSSQSSRPIFNVVIEALRPRGGPPSGSGSAAPVLRRPCPGCRAR